LRAFWHKAENKCSSHNSVSHLQNCKDEQSPKAEYATQIVLSVINYAREQLKKSVF